MNDSTSNNAMEPSFRCAIYKRAVSHPNHDWSLEHHEKICRDAITERGMVVEEHFVRGGGRDELDSLLTAAKSDPRPFDYIVMAHAERASRDFGNVVEVYQTLRQLGVDLWFVTDRLDSRDDSNNDFESKLELFGMTAKEEAEFRRKARSAWINSSPHTTAKSKNRSSKNAGPSEVVTLEPQGPIGDPNTESESVEDRNNLVDVSDFDQEHDLEGEPKELSEEASVKLADRICELWGDHQKKKSSVAKSRGQLKMLRSDLSARLYTYKKHLVRVGRGGGWASFLRERGIPLSTADSYVKQHEISMAASAGKLSTQEIKAPTKEEVSMLVKKLEPRVTNVLTTPDSVIQFMTELGALLGCSAAPA
jgi:hypothetical protein